MKTPNNFPITRRGVMFVLSSPSGAGKTTITKALLERDPHLSVSVSVTTRKPRPGEVDGRDYIFISPQTFARYAAEGKFLEHAEVYGNLYGTLKGPVASCIESGRDMIFDVDWQGAQALTHNWRGDLVKVFILPPGYSELEQRLRSRNQDSPEVVCQRMARATEEMSHWAEYDYVVINHQLETCINQVYAILVAERLRKERLSGLVNFVRALAP